MFDNIRRRRVLRSRADIAFEEYCALLDKADAAAKADDQVGRAEAYKAAMSKMASRRISDQRLEEFESQIIHVKARHLALEVPSAKEKPTWWDNDYEQGMPLRRSLIGYR